MKETQKRRLVRLLDNINIESFSGHAGFMPAAEKCYLGGLDGSKQLLFMSFKSPEEEALVKRHGNVQDLITLAEETMKLFRQVFRVQPAAIKSKIQARGDKRIFWSLVSPENITTTAKLDDTFQHPAINAPSLLV